MGRRARPFGRCLGHSQFKIKNIFSVIPVKTGIQLK
jgi:hypothetical protein